MPARNMKRNSHWMILIAAAAALTASRLPSSMGHPAGCDGNQVVLRGPNGIFGINADQYDNNMNCRWKIQVDRKKRVQLSFVSFGLEANSNCSYDNVSIYDGTDRSAPLLGTFCGESLPDAVTSSDNTMIVRFKTDRSETRSGFSIYYSVSIPVDGCFGSPSEMRGDSGTFGISDDQTFNYMKCSWKIQGEPSTLAQLHFLNFDLVASTDCSTASVKIYDGNDASALLLHSFCGDSLPSDVTSSGNTVLVHFMHFKLNSANTYEGFKIHYSVFIPVEGCFGSPAEMRGNMGTFGINDDKNLNYMTCSWKIHVEPSKLVQLHFLSFDLVASTDCSTASVKIYDGIYESGPLLYSFCGDSLPGDVTSRTRGNTVLVQFKHNSANTNEGFRIYYSVFIPVEGCFDSPAEMRGDMGTFGISDDQTLNYMTCSWKIQVEHSKLVQLHFLHFDLVASTDCRTANVKIYDGNDALAPLLHSFCGDTLPGDVTSSGNTVLVYFKHDSDNTYNGFKIYYSVFIPVEGCFGSPAEMRGDMGTFGISDDQALSYMTCSWKIQVEPSKLVQLHFRSFDLLASTDCSTASVKVYDGNDTSAPLLHSFCGDSLPGDIMSSGNTVLVYFMHFKLGSANTYEGFTIYYSVFAPVEGCFGTPAETRGDVGTFGVSDDQTLNYMTCSWKIQVDPSKLVQLHFLSFDLLASTDCSTASIKIYDGNDTSAPLLHSFCGDNLPCNVTSSGNTVLVQFMHFKQHSANTYKGFKIYYAVFMPVEGCTDPPVELRGSKGTLGISEDQYHNNMRCGWRINVEPSKLVQLYFLSFGLLASADCSTASVKIYDGKDPSTPLLRSFCGDSLPGDTISSGNTVLVYFKTGCSDTSGGFSIYYSAFTPVEGCIDTVMELRGSKGTFGISDDQYQNNMGCSWKIQVEPSKRVRLHFLVFELEDCSDCVCDRVDIADVDGRTTPVMSSFCGSTVPNDIFTVNNRVLVYFRTDGFTIGSGFRIYYSSKFPAQGCLGSPATKQGPKGTIGINEIHYDNYMTCGWKIQVNATKRVQLHFLSFELETSTDCSFDSVNIYDGHDTSAPLLQTSCGHTVPDDVASSGDTMFVRFTTDQSGTSGGFNIYYSAFVPVDGCPGTLVELRGSTGTFGISDDHDHTDMRCSWKIQVDPFKRVRLHFLGVHLQESTGCSYESIKVYDGKDTTASLMRTVCGTTIPEDITSSTHTLFVHFSSGDTSTNSAFQIYYSDFVVPGGCHGSAITMIGPRGNFGIIHVQYTNYMRCSWNIQVNSTDIVKLEFVEFSVEACCDSLTVYDGDSRSAPLLGTIRGHTLPRDVFSTNNTMLVCFESDGSGTWNGFEINYKSLPLATVCPDGMEIGPGGSCLKCSHGKYRRHGVEQRCTQCPSGWTTPTEMSVTVLNCTVPDCQPGEMSDGHNCTKCPRGTYQPDRWRTACVDCPPNHTTMGVGSNNITDCKWQCESGLQFDDVTGQCVLCPRGFFKDEALHFDCQRCPNHLTTPGRGSMSASDCSLAGCQQGAMTDGQNCSTCPRGTYQPDSRMTACVDSLNHTIQDVGSYCKYTCDRFFCLNCGMCKENIPQNPEYNYVRSELQSDVASITYIVGACFGVFVLLLVSVVGFVLCYRRRRRDNCSETTPIIPTQQEVGECNETCEVHDTGV